MNRTGKQCRERWKNHLSPQIKKGDWTSEEDNIIMEMKSQLGNQWTRISKYLPGRSGCFIASENQMIIANDIILSKIFRQCCEKPLAFN